MCMVDDAEPWTLYSGSMRRARKHYQCDECKRTIRPDESYYRFSGYMREYTCWIDGKTCAHCRAVASWLNAQCGGYAVEMLLEDLEEHWAEDVWPIHDVMYLGRAIVGMRRRWRRRDGALLPVPEKYVALAAA